jgi:hypothetical protein
MAKQYRVIYTPDPDGVRWNVEIPGAPGGYNCVSWGRSIGEARAHIRDALATALDDEKAAGAAVFVEEFKHQRADELRWLRAERGRIERRTHARARAAAVGGAAPAAPSGGCAEGVREASPQEEARGWLMRRLQARWSWLVTSPLVRDHERVSVPVPFDGLRHSRSQPSDSAAA